MENESLLSSRAVKTNRRIHAAFFTLLRQKEFGKITVSDIAREAGINRKTFYAYYNDLDELLAGIEDSLIDKYRPLLMSIDVTSGSFDAKAFFEQFNSLAREDIDVYRTLAQYGMLIHILEKIEELIVEIITRQLPMPSREKEIRCRFYAQYAASGLLSILTHWIGDPQGLSLDDFTDMAANVTVFGVSSFVRT